MTRGPLWTICAAVDDAPALDSFGQVDWEFEQIPGFDEARVGAALRLQRGDRKMAATWVALADNVPIGYLLAVYVFSLEHLGLTAEIDEFSVLPEHRHSGVTTALLDSAESTFVAAGCTNVSLQLVRRNDARRAFYRRHGYRQRRGYDLLGKSVPGDSAARLKAGVTIMQMRLEGPLPGHCCSRCAGTNDSLRRGNRGAVLPDARRSDCHCSGAQAVPQGSLRPVGAARP